MPFVVMSDVSVDDALAAIEECKRLGRDTFPDRCGFGRAKASCSRQASTHAVAG